jgi:RNA recognition motif-containing protein
MLRPLQIKFANSTSHNKDKSSQCDNIYVSGLPLESDDNTLHDLFSPFGKIHSVLVLPKKQNYHKNSGFVKYQRKEDALAALKAMHRYQFQGTDCIISCSWAKGKNSISPMYDEGRTNIYCTGINPDWKEIDVVNYFKVFGEIKSVAVMSPKGKQQSGESSWVAFVQFVSPDAAFKAIETVHGVRLDGQDKPLSCRFSKHQKI